MVFFLLQQKNLFLPGKLHSCIKHAIEHFTHFSLFMLETSALLSVLMYSTAAAKAFNQTDPTKRFPS